MDPGPEGGLGLVPVGVRWGGVSFCCWGTPVLFIPSKAGFPGTSGETPKTSDRIILTIYGSPNKRLKRNDLATRLGLKPKTLSNHATHLKDECLIRSNGTACELTGKGTQRAKELLQAERHIGAIE